MDKKLRSMLEQAGTIRHLYNCSLIQELYQNNTSLTNTQIKEIRKNIATETVGKYVIVYPPVWEWEKDNNDDYTDEIVIDSITEQIKDDLFLDWKCKYYNITKEEAIEQIKSDYPKIKLTKKQFRKFMENPFHYLESINQAIRKYCWQYLKTEQKQKQPELSILNWKEFFIEENATKADITELYENWIENKKLILIDEARTDYRQNFYDRFGHCFDEKIMSL